MTKNDSEKEKISKEKIKEKDSGTEKKNKEKVLEKDSGLEEDLKKPQTKIDKEKFKDVFINFSDSASLQQIAIAPKAQITLETNLAQASVHKIDKDEEIKYNTINYQDKKEKTYEENIKHQDKNFTVNASLQRARDNPWDMPLQKNDMGFKINPEISDMKKSYEENMFVKSPSEKFEEFKTHDPFQRQKDKNAFYEFR
jgi:hypothetical protein